MKRREFIAALGGRGSVACGGKGAAVIKDEPHLSRLWLNSNTIAAEPANVRSQQEATGLTTDTRHGQPELMSNASRAALPGSGETTHNAATHGFRPPNIS